MKITKIEAGVYQIEADSGAIWEVWKDQCQANCWMAARKHDGPAGGLERESLSAIKRDIAREDARMY